MIILHVGVLDGDLLLWGETPADSTRKARRNTPTKRPASSPFDAGAPGLIAALGEVVDGLTINAKDLKKVVVWLPTSEGRPVASSPLIAEPPSLKAIPQLTHRS